MKKIRTLLAIAATATLTVTACGGSNSGGSSTPNAAPTSSSDTILYGTYPFINLGETRTNGLDLDLRLNLDGGEYGRFTPSLQWSHMLHYTITRDGVSYELAGTHGPSFVSTNTGTPRERGALALTWARSVR